MLGASGVGKTTFLNCVAGISEPSSGTVHVDDTHIHGLSAAKRSEFRLRHVGIVFQYGELMPELSLVENVALPLRFSGVPRRDAQQLARAGLHRVGLADRAGSYPRELSGGEVQRAALARAFVHDPILVLADEPTGMLDEENTKLVANLLATAAHESGAAVLLATHDSVVAAAADRVVRISDRQIVPVGEPMTTRKRE